MLSLFLALPIPFCEHTELLKEHRRKPGWLSAVLVSEVDLQEDSTTSRALVADGEVVWPEKKEQPKHRAKQGWREGAEEEGAYLPGKHSTHTPTDPATSTFPLEKRVASFQSVFFWAGSQVRLQMSHCKPRLSVWCWPTQLCLKALHLFGKINFVQWLCIILEIDGGQNKLSVWDSWCVVHQ